jgi:hypothetical protein
MKNMRAERFAFRSRGRQFEQEALLKLAAGNNAKKAARINMASTIVSTGAGMIGTINAAGYKWKDVKEWGAGKFG